MVILMAAWLLLILVVMDGRKERRAVMKKFWKIFYTIAGIGIIVYGFLYWHEVLPVDNITMGMYCFGFGCMALGEALRR